MAAMSTAFTLIQHVYVSVGLVSDVTYRPVPGARYTSHRPTGTHYVSAKDFADHGRGPPVPGRGRVVKRWEGEACSDTSAFMPTGRNRDASFVTCRR